MARRRSIGGMIAIGYPFDDDGVPPAYQSVGCNDDLKVHGRSAESYGDLDGDRPEKVGAGSSMLEAGYEVLDQRRPDEKERRGMTRRVYDNKF
jgi:hypothetical protein